MGLWGSKQQKDVSFNNPEPIGQVFITDNALNNIVKTVEQQDTKQTNAENNAKQVWFKNWYNF